GLLSASALISAPPAAATYGGANGEIVYASTDTGVARAISPDGTSDHRFTSAAGLTSDYAVGFSAEGSKAVVANKTPRGTRIVLVDISTDKYRLVLGARRAPTEFTESVALSPDGSRVVFCDGFPGHLWTIRTNGRHLTKLPADGYCYADWGANNRIVASKGIFSSDGERVITTMDHDGPHKTVI